MGRVKVGVVRCRGRDGGGKRVRKGGKRLRGGCGLNNDEDNGRGGTREAPAEGTSSDCVCPCTAILPVHSAAAASMALARGSGPSEKEAATLRDCH